MSNFPIHKSDAEWRAYLKQKPNTEPLAYRVTRQAHTEHPFTGQYEQHWELGRYHCVACYAGLFDSDTKFDAGCGWPSFMQALPNAILERPDHNLDRIRTEILCTQCGSHLGHVFPDGPTPTGLRYCLNSAALTFTPQA